MTQLASNASTAATELICFPLARVTCGSDRWSLLWHGLKLTSLGLTTASLSRITTGKVGIEKLGFLKGVRYSEVCSQLIAFKITSVW